MNDYSPHRCDFCTGTVRGVVAHSEPIIVRGGLVLIEGFEIGKCDRCGHAYFPASVVKQAEAAAEHPDRANRVVSVPVVMAA